MYTENSPILKIDQAQSIAHLTALSYQRGDAVYIRYIHPVTKKSIKASKLDFAEANRYQAQGFDLYFVVNGGGDTDSAVTECRAIFYEHDDLDKSIQLGLWQTLGLPKPTIQVDTGGKSIHSYWVLKAPITSDEWRKLQTDLLEFSDGDRTLKNPSRILRLAGGYYMKGDNPGTTAATIVSQSEQHYSYEELRAVIPQVQQEELPTLPQQQVTIRYEDITLPVSESVPLEVCLCKKSQQLIQSGVTEGGRNENGAALARDLIGTANYLQSIGQQFNGDPWQLFLDYCLRCPSGNGWNEGEWKNIWKSAESDRPTPSCRDKGVENCICGWYWNNRVKPSLPTRDHTLDSIPIGSGKHGGSEGVQGSDRVNTKKLPLAEGVEEVKKILKANYDELTENILLEGVREACKMSGYDWERKIIKPIKRDLDAERFRFDLLNLLAVDDEVERIRQQAVLAPKYQMSSSTVDRALQLIKQRTTTPETQWYGLDDFFNLESEGLKWIIPELLPQGETIILAGAPKSGKTLLAIDAAFSIATGESDFLKETVTPGRVLIISVDESAHSTKAKLIKRGFRKSDTENVQVMTRFDVRQMKALEERLESFRPTLVIIDSLKRINHGQEISENSAEFADSIYTIKEMLTRYGAAGILIHHTSKNPDALGVGKLRGSSAIAGAVWGTWQLDHIPQPDPHNKKKLIIDPKDPRRILSVFARDTEGQQLRLELDLENNRWINHGGVGDSEEWEQERKTLRIRIIEVLTRNSHEPGLSGREIIELMGMTPEEGRSVYSELNRMVGKRLLNCQPAPGDKRYNIYSLPGQSPPAEETENPPGCDEGGGGGSNPSSPPVFSHTPPSPPLSVSVAEYSAENHTQQSIPIVSKIVSNYSADSQQPVGNTPPADYSNRDIVGVSEILSNLNSEVGGGCVETESEPTFQPHQSTTPATAPVKAQAPQPTSEPTKEEWLSAESLQDMAGMLSTCTSNEEIAELRKVFPDFALRKAGNLLDAESRERIKGLVLELNAQPTSENPAQVEGFNNESLLNPTEQSQTQPFQNLAPTIELHTGMYVRCADGFHGHLGAQATDGRWYVLRPKTRKVDAESHLYTATDIIPMPTQ